MRKFLIFIGVLVVVGVAAGLVRGRIGGTGDNVVEIEALAPRDIQATVLASGQLAHEDEVQLSTEEIGKVTAIYVEEGDKVTAGQLLLQIDDELLRAAVEQNEANVRVQEIAIQRQHLRVENLRAQWNRKQELFQRDLLDRDSFDLATNELEIAEVDLASTREALLQARAQLEQALDRLGKTRAFSPIDGIVTSLDIKVGETAISSTTNIPGSSLMTIANPDSIHTEVNVDEADIASIQIGQRAQIFAVAYPDRPIEGEIRSIAVSAKVAEGAQGLSFAVKIALKDTENITLRPGMSCRAEIFTDIRRDILATPIQAILIDENLSRGRSEYFVFVRRDGKAVRVPVEAGISDDAYQEIRGDIAPGDEIIIGPDRILRNLKDGDTVSLAQN
jgi:HlyD family secretion protein